MELFTLSWPAVLTQSARQASKKLPIKFFLNSVTLYFSSLAMGQFSLRTQTDENEDVSDIFLLLIPSADFFLKLKWFPHKPGSFKNRFQHLKYFMVMSSVCKHEGVIQGGLQVHLGSTYLFQLEIVFCFVMELSRFISALFVEKFRLN